MIARTYCIENPARLSTKLEQLVIESFMEDGAINCSTRPLQDAGMILLDHSQIQLSLPLLRSCISHNVLIAVCDERHLPAGLFVPLEGHTLSGGRMRAQVEASKPLKKRLWQNTISAKIRNQALVLKKYKLAYKPLLEASYKVRSGDSANLEATAASYYWSKLFKELLNFRRDRYGSGPNPALNYSYAILRAQVARALVSAGLFPFLGIHHKNQYNSMCLADDIMEPFRPFADQWIKDLIIKNKLPEEETQLSKEMRFECLKMINRDVRLEGSTKPLQVAIQTVCSSLAKCYETGEADHLMYPEYE